MAGAWRRPFRAVTLIHNYIYREVLLMTAAIVGVLTFLFVAVDMFKVIEEIVYTDLSIWISGEVRRCCSSRRR